MIVKTYIYRIVDSKHRHRAIFFQFKPDHVFYKRKIKMWKFAAAKNIKGYKG